MILERLLDLLLRLLDGYRLPRLVRPTLGRSRRDSEARSSVLFPARPVQGKEDDLPHVLFPFAWISGYEPVHDGANLGRGQPP